MKKRASVLYSLRGFLLLSAVLLIAGGVLLQTTDFLSAQSPDEDHPTDREKLTIDDLVPAEPYPRPDESMAQSREAGRDYLSRDDSIQAVIEAVEGEDIEEIINLSRKEDFCGQPFRETPPECRGRPMEGIFHGQIIAKDPLLRPVSTAREWLSNFFSSGSVEIEFASRDSRLPEGSGGQYYLVFKVSEPTTVWAGNTTYDKLALIVRPGEPEPIESFAFLVTTGNGLRWIQQLGGDDGARNHELILPETVSDLPGWFGS